jgi:hypothetical protein
LLQIDNQIDVPWRCGRLVCLCRPLFSGEASVKEKFTAVDLIPGKEYRVVAEFADYDGLPHSSGEQWHFVGKNFLPYDDGLTLYIERDGREVPFRLQWRREAQADVIDNFSDFVEEL